VYRIILIEPTKPRSLAVRLEKALPLRAICLIKKAKSEYQNLQQIRNTNFLMFKTILNNHKYNIMFLLLGFLLFVVLFLLFLLLIQV